MTNKVRRIQCTHPSRRVRWEGHCGRYEVYWCSKCGALRNDFYPINGKKTRGKWQRPTLKGAGGE